MRSLIAALVLAFAVPAFAAPAQKVASVTLNVGNMTCPVCPITVKKALKAVPGVVSAKADLDTKSAVVRYDPKVTNPQALIRATTDAGYPSVVNN